MSPPGRAHLHPGMQEAGVGHNEPVPAGIGVQAPACVLCLSLLAERLSRGAPLPQPPLL